MAGTNLFDVLGDENEDPEQIVKAIGPKKEEAAKALPKPVAARLDAGRGGFRGRGDVFKARGTGRGVGRVGPPARSESGEVAENGCDGAPAARGRSAPRGEVRGRGGRGGRGRGSFEGGSRPRREFDRHDGTGRGNELQKRGGGGRGNWGTEDGSEAAPVDQEPAAEGDKVPGDEESVAEAGTAEEAVPAEDIKELTLDEYEALLEEKKASLNKSRAPRSIDTSEFANLKALTKDEEEMINPLEVSSSKEKKAPRAKERKEFVTLETGFKVGELEPRFARGRGGRERSNRGGRGFSGRDRGGERGSAGRTGHHGSQHRTAASINVEDKFAFPSLV